MPYGEFNQYQHKRDEVRNELQRIRRLVPTDPKRWKKSTQEKVTLANLKADWKAEMRMNGFDPNGKRLNVQEPVRFWIARV